MNHSCDAILRASDLTFRWVTAGLQRGALRRRIQADLVAHLDEFRVGRDVLLILLPIRLDRQASRQRQPSLSVKRQCVAMAR